MRIETWTLGTNLITIGQQLYKYLVTNIIVFIDSNQKRIDFA